MDDKAIERINALYRKSKAEGLTPEEAQEQKDLRAEYIAAVKENLRSQLNNVSVVNPDGTVTDLGKKGGKHRRN